MLSTNVTWRERWSTSSTILSDEGGAIRGDRRSKPFQPSCRKASCFGQVQDQAPVGTDDDGQLWVRGDTSVAILYECLSAFFNSHHTSDGTLGRTLEAYLARLSDRNLVSDDCTVGVVICPTALDHQSRRALRAMEPASV